MLSEVRDGCTMEGEQREVQPKTELVGGELRPDGIPRRNLKRIAKPVGATEFDLPHQAISGKVSRIDARSDLVFEIQCEVDISR